MVRPRVFPVVLACLAALAVAAAGARAATLYVDASAPCPGLGTQASPWCTIQAAIAASAHGDVVLVAPGTYAESISFLGRRITLQSTGGAEVTTIDATAAGARAVRMEAGETRQSVLDGFTVTGGANGGIIVTAGASPTVRNCVMTGNTSGFGGGMYVDAGSPLVQNCAFTMNSATQSQNVSGGAVLNFRGSTSVFEDCVFEDNTGLGTGGAMDSSTSPVTVRRCAFRRNYAGVYGGAMNLVFTSGAVVEDCVFDENTANPNLGNGSGGAIRTFGGLITVRRSTFTNNTANQGNAFEHEGAGASVYEDCLFEGNMGGLGGTGFIFSSPSTIERCVFRSNQTNGSGGGLSINSPAGAVAVSVRNSLFVGNSSASFGGGAIFVAGASSPQIVNCTIVGNTSTRGGGIAAEGAGAQPVVANSILRSNSAPQGPQAAGRAGGAVTIWTSNVQGGWAAPGGGNIDADPLFLDPANGDYAIPSGSPCVDAGDNAFVLPGTTLDLARGARFYDDQATADTGVGPAPVVDLGAFEFSRPCPADLSGDGLVNSADLGGLLGSWGPGAGAADIDGDAFVGSADLAALLGAWGACP